MSVRRRASVAASNETPPDADALTGLRADELRAGPSRLRRPAVTRAWHPIAGQLLRASPPSPCWADDRRLRARRLVSMINRPIAT